jgi:hypothetical protein
LGAAISRFGLHLADAALNANAVPNALLPSRRPSLAQCGLQMSAALVRLYSLTADARAISRPIEPICPRERLNQWSRVEAFVREYPFLRTVRHQDARLAVALGLNVGVYAGIIACFAAGLFWLMQPKVLQNQGLAAYKPPPGTVVIYPDPARPPPVPSEPPATVGMAEPAPAVVESPVVATKKEIKKRETRTMPPRERWSPFWDSAAAPSRGFRPWF